MSVIDFKPPRQAANDQPAPPLFNIPPLTARLLGVMVGVHVVFAFVLSQEAIQTWGYRLAFVPARYSGELAFNIWALISPITHIFMHGGWMHLLMNGLMLLAFGAGAERMLGAKKMLMLFLACGLAGAFAQYVFAPTSPVPMVGASGALSGLFAALILRMQAQGVMQMGRFGIWGVAALWVGLSLIAGVFSGSLGMGDVAWAAHLGGFVAGIGLSRLRAFA